jgi:type VI secretion system protein ImpB
MTMARTTSTPPQERINIVYRPASDGATEEVELPLKMLVLGDFTGRADATPIGERPAVRVDRDNFAAVMRESALCVSAQVPIAGRPEDAGATLALELQFASLADFTPERLCEQVAPLREMLRLRRALVALKGPLGNQPAFRRRLQQLLGSAEARAQLEDELAPADAAAPSAAGAEGAPDTTSPAHR